MDNFSHEINKHEIEEKDDIEYQDFKGGDSTKGIQKSEENIQKGKENKNNKYRKNEYIHNPHSHFGGLIYEADFSSTDIVGGYDRNRCNYNGSPIAHRIASDMKFDNMCKRESIRRDKLHKSRKEKSNT